MPNSIPTPRLNSIPTPKLNNLDRSRKDDRSVVRPISSYKPALVARAHNDKSVVIPISAFSAKKPSKPLSTNRTIAPLPPGPKPSAPPAPSPQPNPTNHLSRLPAFAPHIVDQLAVPAPIHSPLSPAPDFSFDPLPASPLAPDFSFDPIQPISNDDFTPMPPLHSHHKRLEKLAASFPGKIPSLRRPTTIPTPAPQLKQQQRPTGDAATRPTLCTTPALPQPLPPGILRPNNNPPLEPIKKNLTISVYPSVSPIHVPSIATSSTQPANADEPDSPHIRVYPGPAPQLPEPSSSEPAPQHVFFDAAATAALEKETGEMIDRVRREWYPPADNFSDALFSQKNKTENVSTPLVRPGKARLEALKEQFGTWTKENAQKKREAEDRLNQLEQSASKVKEDLSAIGKDLEKVKPRILDANNSRKLPTAVQEEPSSPVIRIYPGPASSSSTSASTIASITSAAEEDHAPHMLSRTPETVGQTIVRYWNSFRNLFSVSRKTKWPIKTMRRRQLAVKTREQTRVSAPSSNTPPIQPLAPSSSLTVAQSKRDRLRSFVAESENVQESLQANKRLKNELSKGVRKEERWADKRAKLRHERDALSQQKSTLDKTDKILATHARPQEQDNREAIKSSLREKWQAKRLKKMELRQPITGDVRKTYKTFAGGVLLPNANPLPQIAKTVYTKPARLNTSTLVPAKAPSQMDVAKMKLEELGKMRAEYEPRFRKQPTPAVVIEDQQPSAKLPPFKALNNQPWILPGQSTPKTKPRWNPSFIVGKKQPTEAIEPTSSPSATGHLDEDYEAGIPSFKQPLSPREPSVFQVPSSPMSLPSNTFVARSSSGALFDEKPAPLNALNGRQWILPEQSAPKAKPRWNPSFIVGKQQRKEEVTTSSLPSSSSTTATSHSSAPSFERPSSPLIVGEPVVHDALVETDADTNNRPPEEPIVEREVRTDPLDLSNLRERSSSTRTTTTEQPQSWWERLFTSPPATRSTQPKGTGWIRGFWH